MQNVNDKIEYPYNKRNNDNYGNQYHQYQDVRNAVDNANNYDNFVKYIKNNNDNITTLADLQKYAEGTVVRFPDFAEGQPFVARVRRPSMLVLAKQGKIPNSLLASASELFAKGGSSLSSGDENTLANIYDICEVIVRASLIQPTYDEIIDSGMELSDDQIMAIFNYTQNGVKALESFRKE